MCWCGTQCHVAIDGVLYVIIGHYQIGLSGLDVSSLRKLHDAAFYGIVFAYVGSRVLNTEGYAERVPLTGFQGTLQSYGCLIYVRIRRYECLVLVYDVDYGYDVSVVYWQYGIFASYYARYIHQGTVIDLLDVQGRAVAQVCCLHPVAYVTVYILIFCYADRVGVCLCYRGSQCQMTGIGIAGCHQFGQSVNGLFLSNNPSCHMLVVLWGRVEGGCLAKVHAQRTRIVA